MSTTWQCDHCSWLRRDYNHLSHVHYILIHYGGNSIKPERTLVPARLANVDLCDNCWPLFELDVRGAIEDIIEKYAKNRLEEPTKT